MCFWPVFTIKLFFVSTEKWLDHENNIDFFPLNHYKFSGNPGRKVTALSNQSRSRLAITLPLIPLGSSRGCYRAIEPVLSGAKPRGQMH